MRLRIAAILALAGELLFVPIELSYRPRESLGLLLVGWGLHTALSMIALVTSYLPLRRQQIDRLVVALILGYVANGYLYLALLPHNPTLVSTGLSCLLVMGPVFFGWSVRRTAIVAAITWGGFALVGTALPASEAGAAAAHVALAALVLGAGLAIASARVLGHLRATLARRRRELVALSARLMSAQEEERRRLARELHDEFGQSLTAVNAYLWLLERPTNDLAAMRAQAAEARRVVSRTLAAMRELSQLLRPLVLDDFGLVPSLDGHLKAFGRRHGLAMKFTVDGVPERLQTDVETALYRITQEALTNVARHAHATRVCVRLAALDGELRLEVEDDGVGIGARNGSAGVSGTGLIGIRERVRALGGKMSIQSGSGTCLRVVLPLRCAGARQ
jgi:signal transduction histidine kinase